MIWYCKPYKASEKNITYGLKSKVAAYDHILKGPLENREGALTKEMFRHDTNVIAGEAVVGQSKYCSLGGNPSEASALG